MGASKSALILALCVFAVGFDHSAQATVIYDAAADVTIDTPVHDNHVLDHADARVVVGSGGVIVGIDPPEPGMWRTAVRVRRGSLEVSGDGRVIASGEQDAINFTGAPAHLRLRDRALIQGDIYADGTSSGWQDENAALQRLIIQDQAVVNGDITATGYIRVQDQALITGSVRNSSHGSMRFDMTGGTVAGNVALGGLNDYIVNIDGGSILGLLGGPPSWMNLTIRDGYIGGGVISRGTIDGVIKGGRIDGGIAIDNITGHRGQFNIFGGQIDAAYDGWLLRYTDARLYPPTNVSLSTLDIWGGQFGYAEEGYGVFIDDYVNFTIHGRGLAYSDGWLSGYLMDGNWFSSALTFGSNWRGSFNIHNVPEPGTLGIFGISLIGMACMRRRYRKVPVTAPLK